MDRRQTKDERAKPVEDRTTGTQSILQVFKLHEKSLRHYISSFFIRPQDIEDISQETFLRTYKSHQRRSSQT